MTAGLHQRHRQRRRCGLGAGAIAHPAPEYETAFHDRFSLTDGDWKFAERRGSFWI
jgi:hypothetical protein